MKRWEILIAGKAASRFKMTEASLIQSPFAVAAALRPERGMRTTSPTEVDSILSAHHLSLETDRKQGARADLPAVDIAGMSFVRLNLRRVLIVHARLSGADLSTVEMTRANLIGATLFKTIVDPGPCITNRMTNGRAGRFERERRPLAAAQSGN